MQSSGLMQGTVKWYGMEAGGPDDSWGYPPGTPGGPEGGCPPGRPTIGGVGVLGEPPPPCASASSSSSSSSLPPGPYPPPKGGSGGGLWLGLSLLEGGLGAGFSPLSLEV